MKKRELFSFVVLAALLLAGTVPARGAGFSRLTFEIASDRGEVGWLEPIPLVLRLSNGTGQPVRGHADLAFADGKVDLYVLHGGSRRQVELSDVVRLATTRARTLAAGERVEQRDVLQLGLETVFPRPGVYHLQAVLRDAEGAESVVSNRLTLRVTEPDGSDAPAAQRVREIGTSQLYDGAERETLEAFVTGFGRSVYARYASLELARLDAAQGRDSEAILELQDLAREAAFPLLDEVLARLIEAHVHLGERAAAESYFSELAARYPGSEALQRAETLVGRSR
jgi:hypothetical protein